MSLYNKIITADCRKTSVELNYVYTTSLLHGPVTLRRRKYLQHENETEIDTVQYSVANLHQVASLPRRKKWITKTHTPDNV